MKTKTLPSIQPYNDMWFNCVHNNLLAMLIHANDSYKNLTLTMGVTYMKTITDQYYSSEEARLKMLTEGFLFPSVQYSSDFLYGYFEQKFFSYPSYDPVIDYLRTSLLEGYCIFLMIDRYYYPSGREAGKTHMIHPVFLIDYDEDTQCFVAIEDCITPGFMAYYELPLHAIKSSCLSFLAQGKCIEGSLCKVANPSYPQLGELAHQETKKMITHLLDSEPFYNKQHDLHYYTGLNSLRESLLEMEHLFTHLQEDSLYKSKVLKFPQLHARNQSLVWLLRDSGYLTGDNANLLVEHYKSLQEQWEVYKSRSYMLLTKRNMVSPLSTDVIRPLTERMTSIISLEQTAVEALKRALQA